MPFVNIKDPNNRVKYYDIINHHEMLLNKNTPVNTWELLWLVGSEEKHFTQTIDKKYFIYLSLKNFNITKQSEITQKENDKYPWYKLAKSIEKNGFTHPLLAVKSSGNNYYCIEGKHRLRATSLIEPYEKAKQIQIPCLVLVENVEYTELKHNTSHINLFVR